MNRNATFRITTLMFAFLFSISNLFGQDIIFNNSVAAETVVCEESETFTVEFENASNEDMTNMSVQVTFPTGFEYVVGTLVDNSVYNVQESNVSNTSSVIFTMSDLPEDSTVSFQFDAIARYAAVGYQNSGNTFRNTVAVDYTIPTGSFTETAQTDAFNILKPALSIINVTEMVQQVFVGGSFTRDVTIINGGYGKTSTITLKDVYDANNLTLNGSNIGVFDAVNSTITLSGADFASIGNGDNYLDRNESITITESITAQGCTDVQSQLYAYWGCDGGQANSNNKWPYTDVSLYPPNIVAVANPSFNTCMDYSAGDVQELMITNKGTGPANSFFVTVYQTKDNGYDQGVFSRMDENSFTYKQGVNGSPVAITPSQTYTTTNTGSQACLGANAIGKVDFNLPVIQPGDTIYVSWKSHTCDNITTCGWVDLIGWDYEMSYSDMCMSQTYNKYNQTGQPPKEKYFNVFAEYPSDLVDQQTEEFTFRLSSSTFNMPQGNNPYFEVEIDVPNGLTFSGNVADLNFVGSNTSWPASYFNYNTTSNKITARYSLPAPINLLNSEVRVNLTGDCSAGVSGNIAAGFQLFYIMDDGCSPIYRMPLTCYITTLTNLHCPGGPCVGMGFNAFDVYRTSYGAPDNNQDGLADGTGSLDMSKLKLNRVMAGDTFQTVHQGKIHTNATYPNWAYGYAVSNLPNGNQISTLSATLEVYDASAGVTITCNNVPFTEAVIGGVRKVNFDFSPATLAAQGCGSFSGFVFENDDIVKLYTNYKAGNIGGSFQQVNISNEYYVSDVVNPSSSANKFQCDSWSGNFTMIGYYWENYNRNNWSFNNCERAAHQFFRFRMGTGPENANFFPYEYRNWGNVKQVRLEVPSGYSVTSAFFRQYRTRYTNVYTTQTQSNITPVSATPNANGGTSYIFDIAQYYDKNGGNINLSDDGFYGYIQVNIDAPCTKTQNVYENLEWYYTFEESAFLGGNTTSEYSPSGGHDRIRYRRGSLSLSTFFQTVEATTSTTYWDVKVKNTNIAAAPNSFFAFSSPNITVLKVIDLSNNQEVSVANGIYQLGQINKNATKSFRIVASAAACGIQQLDVHTGFDCDGYPSSFSSFPCEIKTFPLYIDPQPSELQVRINGISPPDPCANSVGVEIEMTSAVIASVRDLFVTVEVPGTQTLLLNNDSTYVAYPVASGYNSLTTPSLVSNVYTFSAADLDSIIAADGLVGVTDITSNTVKLKFLVEMGPSFKPGELIKITVGGKRVCGTDLPSTILNFDPNASFDRINDVGLNGQENNWATTWADYDGDGFVDLFLTNYETNQANQLYKNDGDGTFTEVTGTNITTDLASSTGATWGDYDNDGDLDLFVANNIGYKNFLYRNNGDGTFTSITNDPIVNDIGYAHGCAWVDYDNDGFLDLFTAEFFSTRFNNLYHNNGDGTFTKVTNNAIVSEAASSVSGVWSDYDSDGDQDLFVANTADEDNSLYRNDGNGQFTRMDASIVSNDGGKSVGASWGDIDNDGDFDLFVANSGEQDNFLYTNNGDGTFTKVTTGNLVTEGGNSHGTSFVDFDNDGDLDLFVANDNNENNFLYSNNGDGTFTHIDNAITTDGGKSFGSAWADFDQDGDWDLFIANHDDNENFIYENKRGRCFNKACITLVGSKSNRSAIGAVVKVKATIYGNTFWQTREITAQSGGGISGQNEMKAIIGMGNASQMDSMIVEWPSGLRTYYGPTSVVDCTININEPSGSDVCGTVFNDVNKNCVQDAGELGIPNVKILIQPGDRYAITDTAGNYKATVEPGTYTVSHINNSTWEQACPANGASHTVNVVGVGNTYCGNDFADTSACAYPDLYTEVATTAFRIGFESVVAITYGNNGSVAGNDVDLTVTFDDELTILETTEPWDLEVGNDRRWILPSLPFGQRNTIYVKVMVNPATIIGDSITLKSTIYQDPANDECESSDNVFNLGDLAVGAFDPNDILVSPEGYITNDQELTYKIRFQNVGNALVNNVVVRDELPADLDLSTLVLGSASHPYRFDIEENTLVWSFDNINLADSVSNEPESHGFVTFKIFPKAELDEGTRIDNKAAIFFDNLAPVITNTVTNIIGSPIAFEKGQLSVFPNPMVESSNIILTPLDENSGEEYSEIYIYDALGHLVFTKNALSGTQIRLSRGQLSTGYYTIKAVSTLDREYTGKLVVF